MSRAGWLDDYRQARVWKKGDDLTVALDPASAGDRLLSDISFNRHSMNDGSHVSPYDNSTVQVGVTGLEVQLLQGIDEASFKQVLARATRATTGLTAPVRPINGGRMGLPAGRSPEIAITDEDWQEMMKGGLQAALETQTIVFEVWGASRALTHQLVRSRRAGFHQQSQRATYYGDRPEVRMPQSIIMASAGVRAAWMNAIRASWEAYEMACGEDVSYQDARYILGEGTTNYIQCEYTIREFINVFAYRGCSMFLWEMVACMRKMREVLLAAHPFLEPYVKISCEKGALCLDCRGSGYLFPDGVPASPVEAKESLQAEDPQDRVQPCPTCSGNGSKERKCTFQGWENVEGQCSFPWAKQSNRTFLPNPKFRIGAS